MRCFYAHMIKRNIYARCVGTITMKGKHMEAILIKALAPTIATVLSTLASWALLAARKYIAKKTENEAINSAMERITNTVQTVVDDLAQTMANEMKTSGSGKLTNSQKRMLKDMAKEKVMSTLAPAVINGAGLAVNSVSDLIEKKIEQAVLRSKK